MLLAWLLYPLIKLVHETSHGLAVQRWGGAVREAGASLLVLMPVPYVNASAANAFRHRYQRALVSAAGVMSELALAALAMLAWQWLQPSLARDVALLVMVTGLMSTLLVNGNPLLRFDGYYLLCDALDLRNLASRSARWWAEFAARRLLGAASEAPLEPLPGERPWLVAYAPLSLAYRVVLSVGILPQPAPAPAAGGPCGIGADAGGGVAVRGAAALRHRGTGRGVAARTRADPCRRRRLRQRDRRG